VRAKTSPESTHGSYAPTQRAATPEVPIQRHPPVCRVCGKQVDKTNGMILVVGPDDRHLTATVCRGACHDVLLPQLKARIEALSGNPDPRWHTASETR